MARQVEWSDESLADVDEIVRYIEQQSPENARRLLYRITPDYVRIVGVIHGSRLLSKIEGRSFREAQQAEYVVP